MGLYQFITSGPEPFSWKFEANPLLHFFLKFIVWLHPCEVHLKGQLTNRSLFVVNHNLCALDTLAFIANIYDKTGQYPRGLADKLFFMFPLVGLYMWLLGIVPANPENAEKLMELGHPILVYPGGRNETMRATQEPNYKLQWKQRSGFARVAAKKGYTIVPVGMVGIEEMYKILVVLDFNWIYAYIIKDPNPCPFPIPINTSWEKQYIVAGPCLSTEKTNDQDHDQIWQLRETTRLAVEHNIRYGLTLQQNDPDRYLIPSAFRRWKKQLGSAWLVVALLPILLPLSLVYLGYLGALVRVPE